MDESRPLVPVERDYLDELIKKAAAWDKYSTKSRGNSRFHEDLRLAVRSNDRIERTRTVPIAQTIIVTNLPSSMSGGELMNSFLAAGGIRCYRMFTVLGNAPHTTALITFVTPVCARGYLSYVSKHGFFLSERLPPDYIVGDTQNECIYSSPDSGFQCLFRRIPHVVVKPWLGPGKTDGKFITGDEGGYCNVSHEIEKGATRSLKIIPGIEPKELQMMLSYLAVQLKVESCYLTTSTSTKGLTTTIRFCSVHDAVIVKSYLTSQKAFSRPDGKIVKYTKSPTDKPTENLGWHMVSVPKPIEMPFVGSGATFDTPEAKIDIHESPPNMSPSIAVGEFDNCHCTIERLEAEESDTDSDDREISFSLAKEAFLPYISTSSIGICFTSLSHTPGDNSPPHSKLENQPALIGEAKNDQSPTLDAVSPALEINTHIFNELVPDGEIYLYKMIPTKEVESGKEVDLTEIYQPSRDSIVSVDVVGSSTSMLRVGSLCPGSGEMPSNEVPLSNAFDTTVKFDKMAQIQDTPSFTAQVEAPISQNPLPSKMEIEIASRVHELGPGKNTLKFVDMNRTRAEPTSGGDPVEDRLQNTPLIEDEELLKSWMDDF